MALDAAPWSYALPDWRERLRDGRSLIPALPRNEAKAARATGLWDSLRLPDVPDQPRLADAGGEWFREFVATVLAAENPDTGVPLVSEALLMVPKKNSKTTNAASLALTALMLSERPNGQMLLLGPTQNIANRAFDQASGMIRADERLAAIFHVQEHLKRITRRKTNTTLSVKTFDMNVVTGEIPSLTIVDELHLLGAKADADRVIAQITGGMITNPAALLIYITTQSDTPPAGVFRKKLHYARAVRDGKAAGARFLPVLYEFPEELQGAEGRPWLNPDLWAQVNPNMGLSVNGDVLIELHGKAEAEGADGLRIWASQHLNIEMGLGLHDDRWLGADFWEACGDASLTLDRLIERSEVCVVGIDGGGLDDLLGLAVLGRCRHSKRWLHWCRAWADRGVAERRKSILSRLDDFAAEGDLIWIEGPGEDVAEVADICARLNDAGLLPEKNAIGLDPEGVAEITDALIAAGLTIEQLSAVSQGYRLNAAVQGVPRKLRNRSFVHGARPIMAWSVANARSERRGNAVLVTKQVSGASKIDPLMALFNASMLMSWNPVAAGAGLLTSERILARGGFL